MASFYHEVSGGSHGNGLIPEPFRVPYALGEVTPENIEEHTGELLTRTVRRDNTGQVISTRIQPAAAWMSEEGQNLLPGTSEAATYLAELSKSATYNKQGSERPGEQDPELRYGNGG
jgi:hypothetical protein